MRKTGLIFSLSFFFILNLYANTDSIGVKTINGKLFILHKVEKGQGLFGIARRYSSTVEKIELANPDAKKGLKTGGIIMVPYTKGKGKTPESKANTKKPSISTIKKSEKKQVVEEDDNENNASKGSSITHIVAKKESLLSIAVANNVTMQQIRDWNGLKIDKLKLGQKLIVGYKNKPQIENNQRKKPDETLKPDKTKNDKKDKLSTGTSTKDKNKKSDARDKKEITESGMATLVDDGSIKQEINLAMHKTAPIGSIIRVKNPMNNKFVYVKVISELPKTEENENILIKIGKSTAEALDIRDKMFRVELSYSIETKK